MARVINFEGRQITVPDDATDDEVRGILSGAPPAAAAAPADTSVPTVEEVASGTTAARPQTGYRDRVKAVFNAADQGLGYLSVIPEGFREGLSTVLGAPVDLVNTAQGYFGAANRKFIVNPIAQTLGLPEVPVEPHFFKKPFMGHEALDEALRGPGQIYEQLRGIDDARVKDPDIVQRFAKRGASEVGAAAPPWAGGMKLAQKGIEGVRQLPRLARHFAEPYAVNPVRQTAKEGTASVAAGTGAAAVHELFGTKPGDSWYNMADLTGSIGGVGLAGLATALGRPAGNVLGALTGSTRFADKVIKEDVANQLAKAAGLGDIETAADTTELVKAIENRPRPDAVIPGLQQSLGDATGSEAIGSLEFSRSGGPNSAQYTQRKAANTAAIDAAMKGNEPQGDPTAVRGVLEAERTRQVTDADIAAAAAAKDAETAVEGVAPTQTQQARGATIRTGADDALARFLAQVEADQAATEARAAEIQQRLVPGSDPAVRGNTVRSALEESRDTTRAATEEAYSNTAPGTRETSAVELTEALDRVNAGLTETERGLVPQGMIERVRRLGVVPEPEAPVPGAAPAAAAEPPTTTLKEATDLRSELLRKHRAALADPNAEQGGRNAARVLDQYLEAVETYIRANVSDEEGAALDAARAARREEADRFGRAGDPVAGAVQRQEGGNPRIRDERVAGTFVNPATDQPLQRLFAEADTPAVRTAIRDEILSRIPAHERTNPNALERRLTEYEIPLRQFPELRNEISAAAGAQRDVTAAGEAVAAKRQEFHGDSRALADTTRTRADGTPALLDEQIPDRFVKREGNKDLDALFKRADTPDVRGAIEDHILGKAASSTNTAERITRFVEQYAEPLKHFPGLRDRLEGAAAARGREAASAGVKQDVISRLGTDEKPGTSATGKYLQFSESRYDDALTTVLKTHKTGQAVDEIITTSGNSPEVINGLKKALWERFNKEARSGGETTKDMKGNQPWLPNKAKEFFDNPKNAEVLERLYKDDPEHLKNIKGIVDAMQNVDTRVRTKAAGQSGTSQGMQSVLPSSETLGAYGMAYQRGQVGGPFIGLRIASTIARRMTRKMQAKQFEQVMDTALLNPDFAATLMKEYNPANRAIMMRTAKTYLPNQAATINRALQDDDEDDGKNDPVKMLDEDTKKAVMK